jgi:hypothetical protein
MQIECTPPAHRHMIMPISYPTRIVLCRTGVCVAQILASATNYYSIDKTYDLR